MTTDFLPEATATWLLGLRFPLTEDQREKAQERLITIAETGAQRPAGAPPASEDMLAMRIINLALVALDAQTPDRSYFTPDAEVLAAAAALGISPTEVRRHLWLNTATNRSDRAVYELITGLRGQFTGEHDIIPIEIVEIDESYDDVGTKVTALIGVGQTRVTVVVEARNDTVSLLRAAMQKFNRYLDIFVRRGDLRAHAGLRTAMAAKPEEEEERS